MTHVERVDHQFVDYIPDDLQPGIIYIAPEFGAVMHLCCDGCGEKVSTPLSPAQWQLHFDGETVSLSPSIGNWDLPCRSHYWIQHNRVRWAKSMTGGEATRNQLQDQADVAQHFSAKHTDITEKRPHLLSILARYFKRS